MAISEAESRIMEALWRRGPLVVEDIIGEVAPAQNWSDATVKSLIGRLLKKQAVRSVRRDGRTVYEPLVGENDYVAAASRTFLDRVFGGRLVPFVSHFAEHQALSAEEVAELKALVERLEHGE
jgi:BlaI family penicillinase repressor